LPIDKGTIFSVCVLFRVSDKTVSPASISTADVELTSKLPINCSVDELFKDKLTLPASFEAATACAEYVPIPEFDEEIKNVFHGLV
jgi:hypothetical protein